MDGNDVLASYVTIHCFFTCRWVCLLVGVQVVLYEAFFIMIA